MPVILATGYSDAAGAAEKDFIVLRQPYQLAELSRAIADVIVDDRKTGPNNLVQLRDGKRRGS